MPNLPTISSTGWGTTLNTFLETAHDNGTDATKSGKVKPSGIIGGSTGQILTTNASGVPTWGGASTNPVYNLDTNITIETTVCTDVLTPIPVPAGFAYLFGFNLVFEIKFKSATPTNQYGLNRIYLKLLLRKGTKIIQLGYVSSDYDNGWGPSRTLINNEVPLPLNITGWDLKLETNYFLDNSFFYNIPQQVQIVWWNGQ